MYPDAADRPARERVLVEPDELSLRLARGERVVLLDVRGSITGPPGRPEYEAGHVPGAVFVELETELSGEPGEGGRHPLPDADAFQAAMRAAGVDDDVPVVAYEVLCRRHHRAHLTRMAARAGLAETLPFEPGAPDQ